METKIRALTRADRVFLTDLIKRLIDEAGASALANLIQPDKAEVVEEMADEDKPMTPAMVTVIVETLTLLVKTFHEEMDVFFCSLLSCNLEALNAMAFGVDLDIIAQIVESPEAEDFFSSALRLRNWTKGLSDRFAIKKTS